MDGTIERRVRVERRCIDAGPPTGCSDRRIYAERRMPELNEAALSDSEWDKFFGGISKKQKAYQVSLIAE